MRKVFCVKAKIQKNKKELLLDEGFIKEALFLFRIG